MGLDAVEIVLELEKIFDIEIPDRVSDRLWRVRDLEDLVLQLRRQQLTAAIASVSDDAVRQVVRDVIAKEMALPLETVSPDARLVDDLGIDA